MLYYRLIQTLNYFVSVCFGYGLMLSVMSFNSGIFFSAICGLTFGNFIVNPFKLEIERKMAM